MDTNNLSDDKGKSRKDDNSNIGETGEPIKKMHNLFECADSVIEGQIEDKLISKS